MAKFDIVMPKLGESIIEATITKWLKSVGDQVSEDDPLVEIATDKVDSEIPSPVDGVLIEHKFEQGTIVPVGDVIAVIEIERTAEKHDDEEIKDDASIDKMKTAKINSDIKDIKENYTKKEFSKAEKESERFLSPLVRNIAKTEGIASEELESIEGTGMHGRITKNDLLQYIEKRESKDTLKDRSLSVAVDVKQPIVKVEEDDTIIEMSRMRRLIADHMLMSKQISPHVTSFIEVDMTKIVKWRESNKTEFESKTGERLTYTPIIIEAAAKAIKHFPGINASVDGHKIIIKKNVNIGMATLLSDGNLIVPVIYDADQKNITGMAKAVNSLAKKARDNKLKPDDIQNGTFTVTNLGSFGSITGTPIINQPQVAILAIGAIRKMPAVVETPYGDSIVIRNKMILALTYDHRVVDGGQGGLYLKKVAEMLENFNDKMDF